MPRIRGSLLMLLMVAGCAATPAPESTAPSAPPATGTVQPTTTTTTTTTTTAPVATTTTPTTTTPSTTTTKLPEGVTPAPDWLGTRPVPTDEDGTTLTLPTPPELSDRRFVTVDHLPPPPDDLFHSTVGSLPPDVVARSTWSEDCPVALDDLSYLTVTFWGFDERPHTGELVVSAAVAEDVIAVFAEIYEARFPIESIILTSSEDLEADPTGDTNVSASFVCRPATGGTGWSEHAFGQAIDINPFHNPYRRGDVVLPEMASDYLDRDRDLPGMIHEGDAVVRAFDDIGWGWGGRWGSLDDWMHFSVSGN